jgi:hypothetical protein
MSEPPQSYVALRVCHNTCVRGGGAGRAGHHHHACRGRLEATQHKEWKRAFPTVCMLYPFVFGEGLGSMHHLYHNAGARSSGKALEPAVEPAPWGVPLPRAGPSLNYWDSKPDSSAWQQLSIVHPRVGNRIGEV